MQKSGNYWYRIGTSQAVDSSLSDRASINIVPIGTATFSWKSGSCSTGITNNTSNTGQYKPSSNFIASNCTYNGATGLYYGSGYRMRSWTSADSVCHNLNMRLPSLSESSGVRSGGIPYYTDYTWTSTVDSNGKYASWNASFGSYDFPSTANYVRCVVAP